MSGSLSRNRGRQFEQAVARYMGGQRNHFESEDIRHPVLSVECKHRQRHSRMLVRLSNRFSVISSRACREELLHLFFSSRPGSGIAGRLTTPRVSLQAQPR